MLLSLALSAGLGCGRAALPPPAPAAPASGGFAAIVPGTGCADAEGLPAWTDVGAASAAIGDTGLTVPFLAGSAVDEAASGPHQLVLTSPRLPGQPATVVELLLVPVCETRSVPFVYDRALRRSVAHLAGPGAEPTFDEGSLALGDGVFLQTAAHIDGESFPLWFGWIEVARSPRLQIAVAAACPTAAGDPMAVSSSCEQAVLGLVQAVRDQIRPPSDPTR